MNIEIIQEQILSRFRDAVAETYGDRLERVVLFGSRARGDFTPESDYDVAVFLHGFTSLWTELQPLGEITTDILMDTGAVISAKPFRAGAHRDDRPLMREIARDGLEL
jgi:predicted nucleotidyltransferase